jgi:hypothetical protein
MSDGEVVVAFMTHSETVPMSNDFQEYWSGLWKPITQKCLNVAKHQFVMQKAFELFKAKKTQHECSSDVSNWSELFICEEEEQILTSLCKHVKLEVSEFMDFGLNHHRNRCKKYFLSLTQHL